MPPTYKRKKPVDARFSAISDADSGMPQLTTKQEQFVSNLLSGMPPKDAYRQAYDASGMKETSISVEVCKLRANPKIAQAIRVRQRLALDYSTITRENHLAELARGREIAYELGQASAGIQAEHYRGRVAGLYNDRLALTIGPSDEALLSQLAALLGPDVAKALAAGMGLTSGEVIDLQVSDDSKLLAAPSGLEVSPVPDSHKQNYGK